MSTEKVEKINPTLKGKVEGALSTQESQRVQLRLLYQNINGEELGKMPALCFWRKVGEWFGEANEYGKMRFEVYTANDGIYLREVWIPTPPYCWVEEHVYKLLLPEEVNE